MMDFLPVSRKEMNERGWDQVDFVYISGDALCRPSFFGHAIITRLLEMGMAGLTYSVTVFGNHVIPFPQEKEWSTNQKRKTFTPGGVMGKKTGLCLRSIRNLIRQTYKKTPVILGH